MLTQTRRHSYLVSLLGIRHVVLAVNKIDLVGYSRGVLRARSRRTTASSPAGIGIDDVTCIPLSALRGDNVVARSDAHALVRRPDADRASRDRRGRRRARRSARRSACRCSGSTARTSISAASPARSSAARVRPGDARARAAVAADETTVARIVTIDGDLDEAVAGQSVTLTLADEIDISRGDVICAADDPPRGGRPVRGDDRLDERGADAARPPVPHEDRRPTLAARRSPRSKYKVNVNTLEHLAANTLELNEIGVCDDRARPRRSRSSPTPTTATRGGFILIDRITNDTVGAGMLHFALRRSQNIHWQAIDVDKAARAALERPAAVRPVADRPLRRGKSTIANLVETRAARARRAHLPARRRQRSPRPQQGPRLHRRRSRREHPPRRARSPG